METFINHNLPLSPTQFIGRTAEIREITSLLTESSCRLLTLVGPGGVGKTRLAIEIGRRCLDAFEGGVYLVSLAPLSAPDDIIPAIIDVLSLQFQDHSRDQLTQLLYGCLRTKRLLLILDNFEHLLTGVGLIGALLDNIPSLKILVTSREALNVQDEWIRYVTGMSYPENGHYDDLMDYCAVELFIDRARRLRGNFALEDDPQSVARICQLVEGLPLALELAASWLTTLTPADIVHEIEHGIDILETRSRDVAERHRSMRAVFAHSWNTLSEMERAVFSKLSVFRGGVTRHAAAAVADASLHILASLVDKSLIWLNDMGRYEIHELLRQYGTEQLEATGQTDAVLQAHTFYFLRMLQRLEASIKGQAQIPALDEIEADFENVRTAWYRGVKTADYAAINDALESLNFFVDMRGRYHEGYQMFQFAVERIDEHVPSDQAVALLRLRMRTLRVGLMGGMEDNYEKLFSLLQTWLAEAHAHNDASLTGYVYYLMGIVSLLDHDGEWSEHDRAAVAYFEQSEASFDTAGDTFYMLEAKVWRGAQLVFSLHEETGIDLLETALDLRHAIGDDNGIAWVYLNLAEAKVRLNAYADAEHYTRKAFEKMQRIGTIKGVVLTGFKLCQLLVLKGDFEEAVTLIDELDTYIQNTYLDGSLYLDGARAFLSSVMHEAYDEGCRLAGRAMVMPGLPFHIYKDNSPIWGLAIAACGQGDFDTVRETQPDLLSEFWALGAITIYLVTEAVARAGEDRRSEAAELLGLAFSLPDAVVGWVKRWPLITRLRTQLETELGPNAFWEAWERGAAKDIETELRKLRSQGQADIQQQANQALLDPLTERELEVLMLIAQGLSNRAIAEHLVLSVATVKVHTRHIYNKLNVNSRTQAVARATALSLI